MIFFLFGLPSLLIPLGQHLLILFFVFCFSPTAPLLAFKMKVLFPFHLKTDKTNPFS